MEKVFFYEKSLGIFSERLVLFFVSWLCCGGANVTCVQPGRRAGSDEDLIDGE